MTKKYFAAIAQAMEDTKPQEPQAYWQWRLTVGSLAQLFARHNPRFDMERFLKACGCV
jgi:hypothetical protein